MAESGSAASHTAAATFDGDGNRGVQIGQLIGDFNYSAREHDHGSCPSSYIDVPDALSTHFTGRVAELAKLEDAFSLSYEGRPARCVVYGMPGVGKSQLALKYAMESFKSSRYTHVLWMASASLDQLDRDLSKLVSLLCPLKQQGQGRQNQDQSEKATALRIWLENAQSGRAWLLIFDNVVQNTLQYVRDILPIRNERGALLFTTRAESVAERLAISFEKKHKSIPMQVPSIDDASTLLLASAGLKEESKNEIRNEAEKIVGYVGRLPLAIDQAASFMQKSGSTFADMIDIYTESSSGQIFEWENDLSRHEQKSVMATFVTSFDQLLKTSVDAVRILQITAFLDPESISVYILREGAKICSDPDSEFQKLWRMHPKFEWGVDTDWSDLCALFRSLIRFQKATQEIERFYLATSSQGWNGQELKMHDLVQQLVRNYFVPETERSGTVLTVVELIRSALRANTNNARNFKYQDEVVRHFVRLEEHLEQCGGFSSGMLEGILITGDHYLEIGRHDEAITVFERGLGKHLSMTGENDPVTLTIMNRLWRAYLIRCRMKDARELVEKATQISRALFGDSDDRTWEPNSYLLTFHIYNGDYDQAEEIGLHMLELRKSYLGSEHRLTIISMLRLSSLYAHRYRVKEAKELGDEALRLQKKISGNDHEDTKTCKRKLMEMYCQLAQFKEAEAIGAGTLGADSSLAGDTLQSAQEISAKQKEEDERMLDLIRLTTSANFNLQLHRNGDLEKEEEECCWDIFAKTAMLGLENASTLKSKSRLALIYLDQRHAAKALSSAQETLSLSEKALGEAHERTRELKRIVKACLRHISEQVLEAESDAKMFDSFQGPSWQYDLWFL